MTSEISTLKPHHRTFLEAHKKTIFLVALFITIFVIVRLFIHPINNVDFKVYSGGLKAVWSGDSPYTVGGFLTPPWSAFIMFPLANQPLETWLALTVALYVVIIFDLGTPAGLLLLAHPIFITLLASSNPEWLLVGPGLWILQRTPKGWGRGLGWLFLATKPQTTIILLVFDGLAALRERDWKPFAIAGSIAIVTFAIFPQPLAPLLIPHDWSASVLSHYGVIGAALVTLLIVAIRWKRLPDYKTMGILLTPVWTIYTLQYNYVAVLFTLRKAGWLRNLIFLVLGIGLAYLYWRDYHVAEHVGILGMLLLAAMMAPAYPQKKEMPPEPLNQTLVMSSSETDG